MYGTIFNLKIKLGHEEEIMNVFKELSDSPKPAGAVAWFVMKPDDKEDWIGIAVFESREAHVNNSNRPEQHQIFLKMMEHLESEPEWTDGTYIMGETVQTNP